jgi:hypothetical protein
MLDQAVHEDTTTIVVMSTSPRKIRQLINPSKYDTDHYNGADNLFQLWLFQISAWFWASLFCFVLFFVVFPIPGKLQG